MKLLASLLAMVVCVVFLCGIMGCAGAVVKTDGKVVGYAIGDAQVSTGECEPAETEEGQPAKCEPGNGVQIKGGHLGAGWFGMIKDLAATVLRVAP